MMTQYTTDQIANIIFEAKQAAKEAASNYLQKHYNGEDLGACGFAWVHIWDVKGNTKLGRALKAAGVNQDYTRTFKIWNPSGLPVQNIDCKEAGAYAAADVLCEYGFDASAGSRMD